MFFETDCLYLVPEDEKLQRALLGQSAEVLDCVMVRNVYPQDSGAKHHEPFPAYRVRDASGVEHFVEIKDTPDYKLLSKTQLEKLPKKKKRTPVSV